MLKIRDNLKIYLYQFAIDMRKSINGLARIVAEDVSLKPEDGSLYVFWNKSFTKLKILFYDRNGFVLYYKSLTSKKFHILKRDTPYFELTFAQLDWLLAGLDAEIMQDFPEINYGYFY